MSLLTKTKMFPGGSERDPTEEHVPEGEDASIAETIAVITQRLQNQGGEPRRDVHVKAHGMLKAWFEVRDDLPEDMRHGVLAKPGAKFESWVRFSSGSGESQDDHESDARGVAIKLMGVPGEKLLESRKDALTQDFVLLNHPVFFLRGASQAVEFETATKDGKPNKYFFDPMKPDLFGRLAEFGIAIATVKHSAKSPLDLRYWSQTAYKLGPLNVKFSLRPVSGTVAPGAAEDDPDFLRTAMRAQLAAGDFELQLLMQRQLPDDLGMPVEDPTKEWSEDASPPIPVATLRILKQDFDLPSRALLGKRISFNPWHSLEAHRPLGGINRTRRAVYEAIAAYRDSAPEPEAWGSDA